MLLRAKQKFLVLQLKHFVITFSYNVQSHALSLNNQQIAVAKDNAV